MSAEVIPLGRHDLNEGDIVRLKSGGPAMIVAIADAEMFNWVECVGVRGERGRRRLQIHHCLGADLVVVVRLVE